MRLPIVRVIHLFVNRFFVFVTLVKREAHSSIKRETRRINSKKGYTILITSNRCTACRGAQISSGGLANIAAGSLTIS